MHGLDSSEASERIATLSDLDPDKLSRLEETHFSREMKEIKEAMLKMNKVGNYLANERTYLSWTR